MWIEMSQGSLATYALFGESPYWQSLPQFEYRDAPDGTMAQWRHAFAIALESDNTADLPVMRICVGEPPVKTLQRWRTDNGIDKFPGVREKLGDDYEALRRSPTIIPNLYGGSGGTFSKEVSAAISHIDAPAVLHPVELREEDNDAFGHVPGLVAATRQVWGSKGLPRGLRRCSAPRDVHHALHMAAGRAPRLTYCASPSRRRLNARGYCRSNCRRLGAELMGPCVVRSGR